MGKSHPTVSASAPKPPKGKTRHHVNVEEAEGGAYIIEHRKSSPGEYREPDKHVAATQEEMLEKVASCLGGKGKK